MIEKLIAIIGSLFVTTQTALVPIPRGAISSPTTTFSTLLTEQAVLGTSEEASPAAEYENKKVTIAVLGDSMIDTLGPNIIDLQEAIEKSYPGIEARVLNYGVGGENIEQGIQRITNEYQYLGRKIPSLVSQNPDIVVVESFGYNPFPEDNSLDRHWMALARIKDIVKKELPKAKLMFAVTLAPNSTKFAEGALGLSFTQQERTRKTNEIKDYLVSTIRFAKGEKIPLADIYSSTIQEDGDGDLKYINPGDHIHPSDEGRKLFADVVAQTITEEGMIQ